MILREVQSVHEVKELKKEIHFRAVIKSVRENIIGQ